jgi:hypothetical protein
MSINDLTSSIQSVIQQGYLERRFRDPLKARLGFRSIAERFPFTSGIGETVTKTRTGLLPPVTVPMAPAAVGDLTSGLTNHQYGTEQFILSIAQYAGTMQLNVATSRVAIASLFLRNAYTLGEQAARSVDTIAQLALFGAYMGGNTRVTATLGAAGSAVKVDDVRGFIQVLNAQGTPVGVSGGNPLNVTVGNGTYALTGVVADGQAPSQVPSWIAGLAFSGTGSNTSTAPGGYSGTLTFATSVPVADGTAGNAVTSAVAPSIQRPLNSSTGIMAPTTAAISAGTATNSGRLTIQSILEAKATLKANNVPVVAETGLYHCYVDPIHVTGLYSDPVFQSFFRGREETPEYRDGEVARLLGVRLIETNLNPVQTLAGVGTVRRAIVCGEGALVEGTFSREGYEAANEVDDGNLTELVDDIALITREPIDALKQVVTQTWSYIGGFVVPTDTTASPTTIPTASNAAYKRAVIVESL